MGNIVSSSNVYSQLGQEASLGSAGAAGTRLKSMKIEPGREITVRDITAQGHRFPTGTVLDKAWSSFQVTEAVMTYTEHVYCLENIFGAATLTSPGTLTKKRVYTVPLVGGITPKTWTQQWGDPADNVNQYGYGLLTDYGEKWDRDSGFSQNGTAGLAQVVTTGGTFTASPKVLAEQAIGADDFNVYLDTTGANLGTTQITDEINSIDWSVKGMKSERWASDRSQASFKGHVDLIPKWELKFVIFEGSVARPIITSLINGQTYFLRLDAQNILIDNYFTVGVGAASAGTFTLTYKGQTTAAIAYNATFSAVQTALTALTTVGAGNATVTGTAPNWTVTMSGTLATDSTVMTGAGTGLTGGTFAITATQLPYMARRDFAIRLNKIAPLKDTKGVYGRELTFSIVESSDAGWANGLVITSQTAEASL